MATSRLCSIPGCGKPSDAHTWCKSHGYRWRTYGDPLGGPQITPYGEPLRFFREVVLAYEGKECLTWPYATDSNGYAKLRFEGQSQLVSRLVCVKVNGPPPTPKHEAAHSCGHGNLACVTKGHLDWKTSKANNADKLIHGTHNRGERSPLSKLRLHQVLEIRKLRGTISQSKIAAKYGVTLATINDIQRGRKWKWAL